MDFADQGKKRGKEYEDFKRQSKSMGEREKFCFKDSFGIVVGTMNKILIFKIYWWVILINKCKE